MNTSKIGKIPYARIGDFMLEVWIESGVCSRLGRQVSRYGRVNLLDFLMSLVARLICE